ncbi:MAG: DUF98 domain-containing protein [Planctomycetes bacterium]|nr:DUF98 domain-containing protein [Planctomycetota bacterium]
MTSEPSVSPEGDALELLRIDLQQSLRQSAIDPRNLSAFQRILLTTDGTVTEILEAWFVESMRVVKLFQDFIEIGAPIPHLETGPGARVLLRKILLRGKCSHKNYLHAESIILPDRLDERLRQGLLAAQKPLGQLMIEDRLETFREILSCRLEPARELGEYFDIAKEELMILRTYRIFAGQRPILLITERFPESYFHGDGR